MNVFLRNFRFRQLSLANLFSSFGKTLFDLVFILYAATFPNAGLAVGIVTVITSLPYAFNFILGYLSDKTTRRYQSLVVSKASQTGLYICFAFLTLFSSNWWVFALVVAINVLSDLLATYNGYTTLAITTDIVPEDDLPLAFGFESGLGDICSLAGQAAGTALIVFLNNNYFHFGLINALFFALSLLLILPLRGRLQDAPKASDQKKALKTILADFFRETWDNSKTLMTLPTLRHFIALFLLMNFVSSGTYSLLLISLVSTPRLHLGSLAFTLMLVEMVQVASSILGALLPLKAYRELPFTANILAETLASVLLVANILFWSNAWLLLVSLALMGYLGGVSNPRLRTLIITTVPKDKQNAIFSIFGTLVSLTVPLASMVILASQQALGDQISWWLIALLTLLSTLFAYRLWRRERAGHL